MLLLAGSTAPDRIFWLPPLSVGVTTSEVQRWRTLAEAEALQEEVKELEERVEQQLAAGRSSGSGGSRSSGVGPAAGGSPVGGTSSSSGNAGSKVEHGGEHERRQRRQVPPNPYDRGVLRNLGEVLFPHQYLRLAASSLQDGTNCKKQW